VRDRISKGAPNEMNVQPPRGRDDDNHVPTARVDHDRLENVVHVDVRRAGFLETQLVVGS
jgi:hypothetical protein